ncbi:type IV toxin-antitoxin system AbiEi family antitoxin domain-containing protein [Chelativorans xinjiangense]|uniref:type IV toxin-antitoxin system AbiEi family antitoxin domain-containing protein n=1 Tax=Chelativorans xinjiangense TaxID=2681485 RepID=UPI001356C284|nr:type IV toxin-antitoxin system AbiEi family antitoxin domain-containing protein [Chelativorans xinjiangense]
MGATQGTLKDRALTIAKERGIARVRDFDAAGVPRAYLRRLQDQGLLVRPGAVSLSLPMGMVRIP